MTGTTTSSRNTLTASIELDTSSDAAKLPTENAQPPYNGSTGEPDLSSLRTPSGTVSLAPYEFQEVCFDLAPQDEVQYDFRSDQPIDFDIHYHDGLRIKYPVKLTGITDHADRLVAELDQTHCLMWFNRSLAGTLLHYQTSGP